MADAAPADAVIDALTGLDGRSLIPFIDLDDAEEVRLFVDLVRTTGNETALCGV